MNSVIVVMEILATVYYAHGLGFAPEGLTPAASLFSRHWN